MKKQLFTILLFVLTGSAFAQFSQGTKMVGGSLSFSSTKEKSRLRSTTTDHARYHEFSLAPQFGYFIAERFALGAGLDLSLSGERSSNSRAEHNSTTIQFTPFVRYYLPQRIFFEGKFGFGTYSYNGTNGNGFDYDGKQNVSSWALAAGYAIMLNESVAIEPMLGYGSTIAKDPDEERREMYPGLFFRMGFQVYLR
jgi:hypothetical protein